MEKRMCKTFKCGDKEDNLCCMDCDEFMRCEKKCRNTPTKCGLNVYVPKAGRTTEERKIIKRRHTVGEMNMLYDITKAAKRIQAQRQRFGITIDELAKGTGIGKGSLSNILYNGVNTNCTNIAKICDYLNLSMDEVMGLGGGAGKEIWRDAADGAQQCLSCEDAP